MTDGKVQPAQDEPHKASRARWSEQDVDRAQKRELVSTLNEAWKSTGVMVVAHVDPDQDESKWRTDRYSQHLTCEGCGRSFESLNPHNFSFNSPLGWCPSCEGLGVQQGANPALLIRDPKLTLRAGAMELARPGSTVSRLPDSRFHFPPGWL